MISGEIKMKIKLSESSLNQNDYYVSSIIEENDSIFWAGTLEGLMRINVSTGKYKRYAGKTTSSNINSILSLCPDPVQPNQFIWAGMDGGGLNKFDKKTGVLSLDVRLLGPYVFNRFLASS
jgi:ligand-binding sensor domain-containing protein